MPDLTLATAPVEPSVGHQGRIEQLDGLRAIAILAEALGSIAAHLCLENDKRGVGQALDVHSFLPVGSGPITGRASPVSITSSKHIWRIDLRDEAATLVGTASLTMAILGS